MVREVARGHQNYLGVVQSAQHFQLVLGVVSSHLQGEELGYIHLLCGLVEAVVHCTKLASAGREGAGLHNRGHTWDLMICPL